jgi:hypothetical protein
MFSTGPMYFSHRLWHLQATSAETAATTTNGNATRLRIIERFRFEHEYFRHLVGSSWHRWDGLIIWFCFCYRYAFLVAAVVLVVSIVSYMAHRRNSNCFRKIHGTTRNISAAKSNAEYITV